MVNPITNQNSPNKLALFIKLQKAPVTRTPKTPASPAATLALVV
jgi:hypothetical protein